MIPKKKYFVISILLYAQQPKSKFQICYRFDYALSCSFITCFCFRITIATYTNCTVYNAHYCAQEMRILKCLLMFFFLIVVICYIVRDEDIYCVCERCKDFPLQI